MLIYTHSVGETQIDGKGDLIMMEIGIPRKLDELGRLVIPKELRKLYHINRKETVVMISTVDGILIKNPDYEVVRITKKEKR